MFKTRMLLPRTRAIRPLLALLIALAGCGASPQPPGAAAPTDSAAPGAPTAYPAPASEPTAYPAPASEPTAYPAPLGGAPASTAMPAPTRPPLSITAAPDTGAPAPVPSPPAGMAFGEVPVELAAVAVADLVQRAGVAASAITVVSGEAVEWPDGAVGCPKPDTMYQQVITPGFKLVLAVSGQQYDYHAADRGAFFLCENKAP